jgi:hypothetical protein
VVLRFDLSAAPQQPGPGGSRAFLGLRGRHGTDGSRATAGAPAIADARVVRCPFRDYLDRPVGTGGPSWLNRASAPSRDSQWPYVIRPPRDLSSSLYCFGVVVGSSEGVLVFRNRVGNQLVRRDADGQVPCPGDRPGSPPDVGVFQLAALHDFSVAVETAREAAGTLFPGLFTGSACTRKPGRV